MLQALALRARADGAQWLWLEVRESNLAAQALYRSTGFHVVGQRRGYYPDGPHRRENAVVMSLNLMAQPPVAAPHCPAWT
jgi:ribosomal-protein-alanine N-acetyltransferase